MIKITDKEFDELVKFMQKNYGINLIKKRQLIEGRLSNYLRQKEMTTFTEYIKLIKTMNNDEITMLINKLTTNHTYFYREDKHYKILKETILPEIEKNSRIKTIDFWSAGCSSGEEPYTNAMAIDDFLGNKKSLWRVNLEATDISQKVLDIAKKGEYKEDSLKDLPAGWKAKYTKKTPEGLYLVSNDIKKKVNYGIFNLMDNIPMKYKNKFDVLWCRNVMIYFDLETKTKLVNRFYDAIKPGGYLFIGHSETVQRDKTKFKYICPAVYRKEE